jgi:hypothetical protein
MLEKVTPHCIGTGFLQADKSNAIGGTQDDKVKL